MSSKGVGQNLFIFQVAHGQRTRRDIRRFVRRHDKCQIGEFGIGGVGGEFRQHGFVRGPNAPYIKPDAPGFRRAGESDKSGRFFGVFAVGVDAQVPTVAGAP